MIRILTAYGVTAVVFAAMDFVWLSLAGPKLYKPELGPLLADKVNIGAAVAFYVLYIAGIVIFAVWPALKDGGRTSALIHGLLFGLIAYATYDLTNQATLRIWSVKVTILDLCWGAGASAVAAVAAYSVTAWTMRSAHS